MFKVVSLKTLTFKWMTIQKFTTLARRHWMVNYLFSVVTIEGNRYVTYRMSSLIRSNILLWTLDLKNDWLWIETNWWSKLWVLLGSLWHIFVSRGTNYALLWRIRQNQMRKVTFSNDNHLRHSLHLLHSPVVMMALFSTIMQTRKMDIIKPLWQILKDLFWQ